MAIQKMKKAGKHVSRGALHFAMVSTVTLGAGKAMGGGGGGGPKMPTFTDEEIIIADNTPQIDETTRFYQAKLREQKLFLANLVDPKTTPEETDLRPARKQFYKDCRATVLADKAVKLPDQGHQIMVCLNNKESQFYKKIGFVIGGLLMGFCGLQAGREQLQKRKDKKTKADAKAEKKAAQKKNMDQTP